MATMPRFGTDPITLAREWIKQQNAANLQDRKTTDRVRYETAKSLTEPEAARRKQEAINSATASGAKSAQEQGLEYHGGKTATRRYGTGTASVGKNASAVEKGLRDGGLTNPYAIAAALGHAQNESGFNTSANGDGGKAFGVFQHNDRAPKLKAWIKDQGGDYNDPYWHGRFAAYEMQTSEKKAGTMLNNAKSLDEANEGMVQFLRPLGAAGGMKTVHNGALRAASSAAWLPKVTGAKASDLAAAPSGPNDEELVPIKPADVRLQIDNFGEDSFKQYWEPSDQVNAKGQILYRRKKVPNDNVPTGSPGTPPADPNSGGVKVANADTPVVLAPVTAKKEDDDDFDPDTGE